MDGSRKLQRSFLEAVVLGLLAATACHLPPYVAGRIDRWLFDLWSHVNAPQPPTDILLVRLEDPAWLDSLAALASHEHAQLVVTTLPQPPSAETGQLVVGPVDIPVGATRVRRTDWQQGGHLWFRTDLDGVVRSDQPLLDEDEPTPSLAFYAAERLAGAGQGAALPNDSAQRWLRFYPGHPFPEVTPTDLSAHPELLQGKVVIAGRSGTEHRTPVGALDSHELVAQAFAGYRDHRRVTAPVLGSIVAWSIAALLLVLLAFRPPRTRGGTWGFTAAAVLGLLAWVSASFVLAGLWLPATGPAVWLLVTGSLTAARQPRGATVGSDDNELALARRATASGHLEQAWSRYGQITPTPALLPELYELACGLESWGLSAHAADLFHRIAQVDGRFRDVAQRLVRSSHPNPAAGIPLDRSNMPATMGRYQLLEPIGRGAMGYVYLGRDPKINRIVALKAVDLAAEFEPDELRKASESFLREAEIAGRLSHPNIVTIFDVGESEGLAYIAMEFLKGRHLSEFATPERLLPVKTVLELLSKTADALDYAHAQNVVHRDIKPANIMYDSISDCLKITDFGIARLIDVSRTRTGIVMGTPAFMSPEQLEGKNVNGHTDLFALGVSLYQLLTGHLPFRGASMTKLMFVIANEPHQSVTAVRPDLPEWLNSLIDRALAKDPADRFQTGAEMAAALRSGAAQVA